MADGPRDPRRGPSPGPDPRRIHTAADLSGALSEVRRRAGLTVRALAEKAGLSPGTVGGYLSGSHLPRVAERGRILDVLDACGVHDPVERGRWEEAVARVYDLSWEFQAPPGTEGPAGGADAAMTSLRPPLERLANRPRLRGRDPELEQLISAMTRPGGPRVHVLHGLGGVGKSFLALHAARWAAAHGISTWWCSGGESVPLSFAMRDLARFLGAKARPAEDGPVDLLWRLLDAHRRPWLLILDNLDDPVRDLGSPDGPVGDAAGWLRPPRREHDTVIITSRDGSADSWGEAVPWIRFHPLRPLAVSHATDILLDAAGPVPEGRAGAEAVATRLGGLPLALRLAGLHLREARRVPAGMAWPGLVSGFDAYVKALDEGRHRDLLLPDPSDRSGRSWIDRTWEFSLEALETRGFRHVKVLMLLLACFAAAPIPYGFLLDAELIASGRLFGPEPPTRRELWMTLKAMAGLGLVELDHDPDGPEEISHTLALHPVLRGVYRSDAAIRGERDDYAALLIALLEHATDQLYPSDPAAWRHWQAIAVHCPSPLELIAHDASATAARAVRPAMAAGQYLRASGRFVEAEIAYAHLLSTAERALSTQDPELLTIRHGLCRVWYSSGDWPRAEAGFRSVLEARTSLLGPDHPDTLAARHYLARVLFDQGDAVGAEKLFRTTLAARRRILGPTHPATISSLSNLATVRAADGRVESARRALVAVLRFRRRVFGEQYPATLITRLHLARLLVDEGVTGADLPGLGELRSVTRRVFGGDHPRALTAAELLGRALGDLGDAAGARAVFEPVLEARTAALGAGHPLSQRTAALLAALPAAD